MVDVIVVNLKQLEWSVCLKGKASWFFNFNLFEEYQWFIFGELISGYFQKLIFSLSFTVVPFLCEDGCFYYGFLHVLQKNKNKLSGKINEVTKCILHCMSLCITITLWRVSNEVSWELKHCEHAMVVIMINKTINRHDRVE